MSAFTKTLLDKLLSKFQNSLKEELDFFKKPHSLIILSALSLLILNNLINKYKSKLSSNNSTFDLDDSRELKKYVNSDPILTSILKYSSNDLNENILSSILLDCKNNDLNEDILDSQISNILNNENFNAQNLLDVIQQTSDFDNKTQSSLFSNLKNKINSLYKTSTTFIPYIYFLYYIIKLVIELLSQNEYPSTFRIKHIQKIIRIFSGLLKSYSNEISSDLKLQFNDLISTLKTLDSIIVAVSLLSIIYIRNRKILQEESTKILKEECLEKTCSILEDASTFNIISNPIKNIPNLTDILCPIDNLDDAIVPKQPFEDKIQNFSCDSSILEEIPTINSLQEKQDLSTSAIIENLTNKSFKIKNNIDINSYLTTSTPIATLDNLTIFSPVKGYVSSFNNNSITIRNYEDDESTIITDKINKLNNKYTELNNIKLFIKDYYINSLYPLMLTNTKLIDDNFLTNNLLSTTLNIGLSDDFSSIQSSYKTLNDNYNNDIQKITGEENVKILAENENIQEIKIQIDNLNNIFYNNIKLLISSGINTAKNAYVKNTDFTLIDYYFVNLSLSLNSIENPNDIEINYRNQINLFLEQRTIIDNYNPSILVNTINKYLISLETDTDITFDFNYLLNQYNISKRIKIIENIVKNIAIQNKTLSNIEKQTLVFKILYLFNFYINISQFKLKYNEIKTNQIQQTINESNYISNFFNNLWKRYNELPKEIDEIILSMNNTFEFVTYSTKIIDEIEYRYYVLSEETCPQNISNEDPYLNPKSSKGFGDLSYWLKYCSFATLTSVLNPITGWSTGLPPPIGPTPLPVVYIPIKPITTKYGFIVLGLSICGLWLFPWVLMTNYSSEYNTPLGNPTQFIKNEINTLKKEISNQLKSLKKSILKKYLDDLKSQIDFKNNEIKYKQNEINLHKESKPSNVPKNLVKYSEWLITNIVLKEQLSTVKTERWKLELKYKIIYQSYKTGESTKSNDNIDVDLNNIKQNEDNINSKLDNLTSLSEKASNILKPLPITLDVVSANFGFTLKNPKPVIKIADKLDDNINENVLNNISERFKLKNNNMGSANYKSSLSNTILNKNSYRNAIKGSQYSIIQKDAFPKYENLNITNIPWLSFLVNDWTNIGAKTFGIPGFSPLPT